MTLWSAVFLGLAGSFHCLGMCGPLALALPIGRQQAVWKRVLARSLYHLGRSATYAGFGLVAGAAGKAFKLVGIQQGLSIGMGALLLLSLFYPPNWIPRFLRERVYAPLKRALGSRLQQGTVRAFWGVGMLNGLLPCGLVYAAIAGASLQGSPLMGGAYMALFGLGTIPMMLTLSLSGLSLQSPRLQPALQKLIPTVTCLVAVLLILRGLNLGIPYISPDFVDGSCCDNP